MTSETSTLISRVAALEAMLNGWAVRLGSDEARLAAVEQQNAKSFPAMSAGGGGNTTPATSGSGIPAISGTTPGSASITLQVMSGGVLTSGQTVTCYNNSATAIGASKNMQVSRDSQGNYWAISWDC